MANEASREGFGASCQGASLVELQLRRRRRRVRREVLTGKHWVWHSLTLRVGEIACKCEAKKVCYFLLPHADAESVTSREEKGHYFSS